jgi:folate-binding protein YgfZ
MPAANIVLLEDRGVVSVTGPDSEKLLQGLVTNDLEGLAVGEARHAGLLTPQGKILFDFFVVRQSDGYLLDVPRAKAGDLAKRLSMYRLRADVVIADVSDSFTVYAALETAISGLDLASSVSFTDPRHTAIGLRLLTKTDEPLPLPAGDLRSHATYDALRLGLGIPEGGKDFEFGDAYPHEAGFDVFNGVSFTKGCYVGQEVVSRMQNKTLVRKRTVKISGAQPLTSGVDILLGEVVVGRVGTAIANDGIAMLRLDRVVEAEDKNLTLTAGGVAITPDKKTVDLYRSQLAARSAAAAPTS